MSKQGDFGKAGFRTEQFDVGSCVYFIHTGDDPDFSKDADGEYASCSIGGFLIFNTLLQKCGNMEYTSIADLKTEVVSKVEEMEHLESGKDSRITEKTTWNAANLILMEILDPPLSASYPKVHSLNHYL
ncbi:hypothetical protein GJ744_003628 [Endocarpon pusillum]|uniref:Uncharacterized protein n=1 Tax=Endocarpon pusillum TaxID=364733 RepID=A0A8H7AE49_9EURO|nr:hypothetical protein GJ744_003628 [Endocarpon pusillum]